MCLLVIMFMIANTSAQTRVIAHRGFWKTQGSAQNSITSLLKADSIGCYGSEFDVWLTKDNGLVVSHDGIIQGHKVEESTLKELTGLWLANGECVPSLKELLETAKRKTSLKLVLELKAHSKPEREIKAVEEIVSMIKKMGLEPRMIYITFSSHALKELIRQAPTSFSDSLSYRSCSLDIPDFTLDISVSIASIVFFLAIILCLLAYV